MPVYPGALRVADHSGVTQLHAPLLHSYDRISALGTQYRAEGSPPCLRPYFRIIRVGDGMDTAIPGISVDRGCRLMEKVGLDAAIDYKAGGIDGQLREVCPDGINLFFEYSGLRRL